ncbi:MAG: heavy metal translocating P-type ATPase [Anaerolineales bacterium]
MSEKTIELEISLLLPNVQDEQDECLNRLETALQNQKGILRAHMERDKALVDLCLHYDPNLISLEQVRRMAARAGTGIANRYHHELLPIEGMDCSDCVTVIEHSLGRMDGVLAVNVNYATSNMRVEYDKNKIDHPAIEKRVRSLGYEIPAEGLRSWYIENREILFSLTAGLLVLIGWLGQTFFEFPSLAATAIYIAAYILGGWDISQHAWHALKEKHFDTDLLMVAAALGAAALDQFAEGALLLFLFSLGHALEERALDHARAAVRALGDMAPKTALTRRNGSEIEVAVNALLLEDVVIVRPGVRIPVDGEVLVGQSSVDQAPVTGESVPVDKNPGDKVFAGTVNCEGALEVRVTRLARDSTLVRVMQMVEEAQTQKSPTQQTTEKFERWFVPAVLVADFLLIVIPPLFGAPFRESFLRAMTLLVAASPCALALGTPSAILAGIAQAARNGVLVKGGAHLENLGRLKAIAFDKTGTITKGKPELTDVMVSGSHVTSDELLRFVAAVESRSAHPLAQAVVRAAQARKLDIPTAGEVVSVTGRGIRAKVSGSLVRVGSEKLFAEAGIIVSPNLLGALRELESVGKTAMLVGLEQAAVGLVAVADVLRADSLSAIAALTRLGIRKSIMLTGDNARTAAHIAKLAGIDEVRADLMPEDKLTVIRALVQEHEVVAMVGDGVNDAPALANATVGIAMGGAGTDVALETADVALMGDDLSKLPFAVGLGRATRAVIMQNLVIALSVVAVLIVASVTGWVGIGVAIVVHEGSTIVVVLNSLRLLGYRP